MTLNRADLLGCDLGWDPAAAVYVRHPSRSRALRLSGCALLHWFRHTTCLSRRKSCGFEFYRLNLTVTTVGKEVATSYPGQWNKYAYAGGDPVNFNDPGGLDGGCPPGFICIWYSGDPLADITMLAFGGAGGGGQPHPLLPLDPAFDRDLRGTRTKCAKLAVQLGLPGFNYDEAQEIWKDGNLSVYGNGTTAATIAALAAVTWLGESSFSLYPTNNANKDKSGNIVSVDYGPFQINPKYNPSSNAAVWGNSGAGQTFNGNPDANIAFGIAILEGLYKQYGNNAAGRYVGSLGFNADGTPKNPNAQNREAAWNLWKSGLTQFFSLKNCF